MKKKLLIFSLVFMLAIRMTSIFPIYATDDPPADESKAEDVNDEITSDTPEIPESAEEFLIFEGYQVRESSYNGLRAIFRLETANLPTLDSDGIEVIEYGTVLASSDKLESAGEELTVVLGESGDYETVSYGKIFPIVKNNEYVGKILEKNDEYVEYACTVTNFGVKTFDKNVTFRGYAVLRDGSGAEYAVYSDYAIESYRSVNLGQICDEMYADGTITGSNISYKNVVSFRDQLKEEEGWGPIWRP